MIPEIKELNFPTYATLSQATCTLQDMAEKTITTQVKIDGAVTPDFSFDWEIEFKGEKYIMPLRQPQAAKENTSLNSTIDLTFQHWAQYQLKRWYFFTIQPVESSTAVADKYIASVSLNLGDFCELFAQVLNYYYGDSITIDLNSDWEFAEEPVTVEISYSYLWDVLIKFYELWAVRWTIEPNGSTDKYVIKIGYPTTELSHIFEYGFDGGLLKVERQVQDENIRNMLLGRGGERNLPYRYFKDVDKNNASFPADPDWIPELANIYFSELRGATFRSYIQGWKAKHYNGTTTKDQAYAPWAWEKGYTDAKFDPVEYVKDDASIAKYGELLGGLENNEEIYPSIQGVTVEPYRSIDEVVDVEPITSDDIEDAAKNGAVISNIPNGAFSCTEKVAKETPVYKIFPRVYFTVPSGQTANLFVLENVKVLKVRMPIVVNGKNTYGYTTGTNVGLYARIKSKNLKVYDRATNEERSASGIPEGSYYYIVDVEFENISPYPNHKSLDITVGIETANVQLTTLSEQWTNTWNIWVKNIWGTEKKSGETDAQYAERVWRPILGDHEGSEAKVVFSTGMLSTSQDYEFVIAKGGIHYDTSKTLNGVQSHWRLTLGKSDADLESTGLYLPSTMRQASAGDHFFFIGIDMPHQYVIWAEERLDNYKTGNLDETKDIKPTWVVSLDKVRINNKQQGEAKTLISQLRVGDSLRLADKRFIINEAGSTAAYEILYLQSITYTYQEPTSSSPALVPDVEVVLSDKYETIANPVATLSGQINALSKQIGAISNVEQIVRAVGDKLYLRKDGIADRSMSPTEFLSLVTGRDFRSGIVGGASWGIYQDANGNWVIEADRFKARQQLEVNNLVINQIIARGGMIIESAAQMEITRVEETADGYICYFDQHGGSVANLFLVDDVAYCNRFTPENRDLKFYKRRVTAVDVDNITLTKGYDPVELPDGTTDTGVNGEGVPEEGDIITQYGNYTDTARQYAKVRDIIGGGYERYLEGLDSVNAAGKEYFFVGKQNEQKPRWFIGYKDGNYAEWRNGELYIKGNIEMGPDSTGLSNLAEFKQVQESADAATEAADAANQAAEKINNLKIGGRNLLLDSGVEIQSDEYSFATYNLSERIYDGQEVTLTIWGVVDNSVDRIVPFNSGGMLSLLLDPESRQFTQALKQTGKGIATFKWRSDVNLFKYNPTSCYNANKVGKYAYKQITADDHSYLKWKIHGYTTDGEYVNLCEQVILEDIGRHTIYFTIPANKEFAHFRFGLNGGSIDTLAIFYADLAAGDYTLSFDLDNNIQGQIEFSQIKILPGHNDDTEWIASLFDRGIPVGNNRIILYSMGVGHNEQNLTTKIIHRIKLEYGNVSTDWTPAPEDNDVSFIKKIFPYGVVNNAATISQLIAVRDSMSSDANIVAGIYGGGVSELEPNGFRDNAHGKLMIFAGASDLEHVATAGTRIYEDGTIITSKLIAIDADVSGKITAINGTIGGFVIGKDFLTSEYYSDKDQYVRIYANYQDGIDIYDSDMGHRTQIGSIQTTGSKMMSSLFVGQYGPPKSDYFHVGAIISAQYFTALMVSQDSTGTPVTSQLSNIDQYNNHALYILHGDTVGFRPYTRIVSSSTTLKDYDSVILCNNTVAITLTFPANPENGQLYFIKNISSNGSRITLAVGNTGHYINDGRNNKKTSWSFNEGCWVMVVWDNANKIWQAGYSMVN